MGLEAITQTCDSIKLLLGLRIILKFLTMYIEGFQTIDFLKNSTTPKALRNVSSSID